MKTLKFNHDLAELIRSGRKNSTLRINDDKDISVNDVIRLVDKIHPDKPETWQSIGLARVISIIEKHLKDIRPEDMEWHKNISSNDAIVTMFKEYYGNDVSPTSLIKIINFEIMEKQQINEVLKTSNSLSYIHAFADGGSRGNPGPSACGYVIINPADGSVVVDKGIYVGVTTNNQAEYLGLKYVLEEAHNMGARKVDVFLDSMLVINQMKGIFKVKNRDLWPLHEAVMQLADSFEHVNFTHVPREKNTLADAAVNRALDHHMDARDGVAG